MRTNIEIDDKLTGLKTKRETVELALQTIVRLQRQGEFKQLRGKVKWVGDLDAMRTDR